MLSALPAASVSCQTRQTLGHELQDQQPSRVVKVIQPRGRPIPARLVADRTGGKGRRRPARHRHDGDAARRERLCENPLGLGVVAVAARRLRRDRRAVGREVLRVRASSSTASSTTSTRVPGRRCLSRWRTEPGGRSRRRFWLSVCGWPGVPPGEPGGSTTIGLPPTLVQATRPPSAFSTTCRRETYFTSPSDAPCWSASFRPSATSVPSIAS